jgi:hypothetical protein
LIYPGIDPVIVVVVFIAVTIPDGTCKFVELLTMLLAVSKYRPALVFPLNVTLGATFDPVFETTSPCVVTCADSVPFTLSPTCWFPAWNIPDPGALEKLYMGAVTLPLNPCHCVAKFARTVSGILF